MYPRTIERPGSNIVASSVAEGIASLGMCDMVRVITAVTVAMFISAIVTVFAEPDGRSLIRSTAAGVRMNVGQSTKGNRLAIPRAAAKQISSTSVDVVGSVDIVGRGTQGLVQIFRDREGYLLVKSDPSTNTSSVAKKVLVPRAPVRETPQLDAQPPRAKASKRTVGCEMAFGPLVTTAQGNFATRCLAARPTGAKLAMTQ